MGAVKLMAHVQKGRDSLVNTIFVGLQEESRLNITNTPRKCIEVDNRKAMKDWRTEEELGGDQSGERDDASRR